jgi:hypothetical protein
MTYDVHANSCVDRKDGTYVADERDMMSNIPKTLISIHERMEFLDGVWSDPMKSSYCIAP